MENKDELQDYKIELLKSQFEEFKQEFKQEIKDTNEKVTSMNEDIILMKKDILDLKTTSNETNNIIKELNANMIKYQESRRIQMEEFANRLEMSSRNLDSRLKPIEKEREESQGIRNDIKKDTIKNLWGRLVDFVIIAILAYLGFKK